MPVPVCRFARAHRCRSLRGLSAFGHDPVAHQTYYGLRLHLRIAWPGVITAAVLAPANEADRAVAPSSSPASRAGRSATRATGARSCAPSSPPTGST